MPTIHSILYGGKPHAFSTFLSVSVSLCACHYFPVPLGLRGRVTGVAECLPPYAYICLPFLSLYTMEWRGGRLEVCLPDCVLGSGGSLTFLPTLSHCLSLPWGEFIYSGEGQAEPWPYQGGYGEDTGDGRALEVTLCLPFAYIYAGRDSYLHHSCLPATCMGRWGKFWEERRYATFPSPYHRYGRMPRSWGDMTSTWYILGVTCVRVAYHATCH